MLKDNFQKMNGFHKKLGIFLLALTLILCGCRGHGDFSKDQMRRMSIFISNFTELGMLNCNVRTLLDESNPHAMLDFSIRHNYFNNYNSSVASCPLLDCPWGPLTMKGGAVQTSLKRYFDYDLPWLPSAEKGSPPYHFDGSLYHFTPPEKPGLVRFARVNRARLTNEGLVKMRGEIYNAENEKEILGTFKAVAKPHTWNGRKTWALVEIHTKER